MAGLAVGAVVPALPLVPRNTISLSPAAGALGRFAVAVAELPVAARSLAVTTGVVRLPPCTCTRSRAATWLAPRAFVKLTVRVPVPLALLPVVRR